MYELLNQAKETIAYIETNMLIDAAHGELAGVLLGNCLFDRYGKLTGKFFGGAVYNLHGRRLAEAQIAASTGELSFQKYLVDANNIVYSITDHADVWIEPDGTWADHALMEELNSSLSFV